MEYLESSKRTVGDKERMCSANNFFGWKKMENQSKEIG